MRPLAKTTLAALIASVGLVAACQTVAVKVPEVATKQPVEITSSTNLAPIKFDTVGMKIKRGAIIGTYDADFLGLTKCYGYGSNIFWNQGRIISRNIEYADIFFGEMKNANFNVVGNPDKLFAQTTSDAVQPRFLVGGQIEDIKINACREKEFWTGRPMNTVAGKAAVRVNWQVFDLFEKRVIFETVTNGSAKSERGVPDGVLVLIQNAFGNAVANLAAEEKLVAILSARQDTIADIRKVDQTILGIARVPPWQMPIKENIDEIRTSVVTIDAGNAHGSGFFIAPNLIMTNHHVIEGRDLVRIKLLTGRTILGEVIRKHSKRDVALVSVEASGHRPIPIRTEPLKITEEVYAIGSPLNQKLAGTVSKGVVSKFASNRYGLEDIQADVDIHGGSSGGVLVDENGNAVGVSYAGYGGKLSVGLNLFIPILDALRMLNIELMEVPAGS